jgi:hypothetical protein
VRVAATAVAVLAAATGSIVAVVPAEAGRGLSTTASMPSTRLQFGLANDPGALTWMTSSRVPWAYRYQYLSGGVNTSNSWHTWYPGNGGFAGAYMTASTTAPANYMPVFSYYNLLQSLPGTGSGESSIDFTNLNNTSTMNAYYADFKLLMQQAHGYGGPVVVHVEPDLWGYMQQRAAAAGATVASQISASVSSSGFTDVNAYANNLQGFACALLHLRDVYAPGGNVVMAIHASLWASSKDIGSDTSTTLNPVTEADKTAAFLNSACIAGNPYGGSTWNVVFNDPANHDAAWFELQGQARWWDPTNTVEPNFSRYLAWVSELRKQTARPQIAWQVPVGNQYFLTMNNTNGHYQDNRAEYFLGHTGNLFSAGIIAVLFGRAASSQTTYRDTRGDGVTNNNGVPTSDQLGQCNACNTHVSNSADDDGGYLRIFVARYYCSADAPRSVCQSPSGTPGPRGTIQAAGSTSNSPQPRINGSVLGSNVVQTYAREDVSSSRGTTAASAPEKASNASAQQEKASTVGGTAQSISRTGVPDGTPEEGTPEGSTDVSVGMAVFAVAVILLASVARRRDDRLGQARRHRPYGGIR